MKFDESFKKSANIEVTTTIGCPVMCSFCPQVSLIKNFKLQNSLKFKDKFVTTGLPPSKALYLSPPYDTLMVSKTQVDILCKCGFSALS